MTNELTYHTEVRVRNNAFYNRFNTLNRNYNCNRCKLVCLLHQSKSNYEERRRERINGGKEEREYEKNMRERKRVKEEKVRERRKRRGCEKGEKRE